MGRFGNGEVMERLLMLKSTKMAAKCSFLEKNA